MIKADPSETGKDLFPGVERQNDRNKYLGRIIQIFNELKSLSSGKRSDSERNLKI